jgi:hypothetical protein
VRISAPGDRNNVLEHPITQRDIQRFPQQYAAFKAGLEEDAQIIGTRLADWPVMTRAQVEEMKHLGFRTVDQIADARDDICGKVPGLTGLKQKARIWLDKTTVTAEATRLDRVISTLQNDNESMRTALADQAKLIEKLQAKQAA